ncbi:unnamed protein product [Calicophoron daubneyi]|uniref:RILP-like protein n=1 Tax=Calicophoron daubneyi TaxID=300641 RepID=A0AAV2T046_CALDB
MPKVIGVLEELEDFAARFDSEGREVVTLQLAVHRLELEKLDRAKDLSRSEKEFQELTNTWQSETRELLQLIDRLKEENSQLKEAIKEKRDNKAPLPDARSSNDGSTEEIQLMLRLKEVIDRQKVELRAMRRQLAQKNVDLDAMQQQATRLAKLNAVLRRKHCVSKRQSDQLQNEKHDLELKLQTKEQLIQQMRDNVCQNPGEPAASSTPTFGMTASMINELVSPGTPPARLTEEQLIERLNADDKMITNRHDSSRPRFTVQELRNLLTERNELKSRLIEVEEELSVYKRAGANHTREQTSDESSVTKTCDDDPPVQGPINREPDEKLHGYRRRNSGIRKFFESIVAKLAR